MYQASNWGYKVGDKIYFGEKRNYQAKLAYNQNFIMSNGEHILSYLTDKSKNNKAIDKEDVKEVFKKVNDYAYCIREYAYEYCREKYFQDCPSRLKGLFLCDNPEDAKLFLTTARHKNDKNPNAKVIKFKLNGKLLKTSNSFNRRDCCFDEFIENAKKYFNGVDENFKDNSVEYLFEGTAEVVEIID